MNEIPGIRQIVRLETVDSTQKVARRMAEQGAPEWTLVVAERQTAGKGRMGRKWSSNAGGLYFSLLLRPRIAPKRLAELSLATADAVARVVNDSTGLKTSVKPPNDVLAQASPSAPQAPGVFKKVCGILIEASGSASEVEWLVLGIGMNVNNRVPKTLKEAASLSELLGREIELEPLLRDIVAAFQRKYQAFLTASNGHIDKPAPAPPREPTE